MNNITPTGFHCRKIGLCYHHAPPLGLHLGYMSPLRGYIVVRLGFSIIMPPLWGCFHDSCHPYGVTWLYDWDFLSSCHPFGVAFVIHVTHARFHFGNVGLSIIMSPLRGWIVGYLHLSIIIPSLRDLFFG